MSAAMKAGFMLLAFVNSKGGVGKSTLAVHAAVWLHECGARVALLDADAQAGSSEWLARAEPGIRVARMASSGEILAHAPRLQIDADVVVADGPAALGGATVALLGLADRVLLPIGPSMMDVKASYQTARMIYRLRYQGGRGNPLEAFTIFNRVQPRTRLSKTAVEAVVKYGFPAAPTVVQLRQAYADACGRGTVVWRMGAAAKPAAGEIRRLFGAILAPYQERTIAVDQGAALQRTGAAVILKRRAQSSDAFIERLYERLPEHLAPCESPVEEGSSAAGRSRQS